MKKETLLRCLNGVRWFETSSYTTHFSMHRLRRLRPPATNIQTLKPTTELCKKLCNASAGEYAAGVNENASRV